MICCPTLYAVGWALVAVVCTGLGHRYLDARLAGMTRAQRRQYDSPLQDALHHWAPETWVRHRWIPDLVVTLFQAVAWCALAYRMEELVSIVSVMYCVRAACFCATPMPRVRRRVTHARLPTGATQVKELPTTADFQPPTALSARALARFAPVQPPWPGSVRRARLATRRSPAPDADGKKAVSCFLGAVCHHVQHLWRYILRLEERSRLGHGMDLIFSGHCTMMVTVCCHWTQYGLLTPTALALSWSVALVVSLMIILTRCHYTVDVLLAWCCVGPLYHVLQPLMSSVLYPSASLYETERSG